MGHWAHESFAADRKRSEIPIQDLARDKNNDFQTNYRKNANFPGGTHGFAVNLFLLCGRLCREADSVPACSYRSCHTAYSGI
jgi:hypothetical protein